jgi:hypothetical protein
LTIRIAQIPIVAKDDREQADLHINFNYDIICIESVAMDIISLAGSKPASWMYFLSEVIR